MIDSPLLGSADERRTTPPPVCRAPSNGEGDPWETINLADDAVYADRRREMAHLLAAGWKAALPPKAKL